MNANLELLEKNLDERIENYGERREHNRLKAKIVTVVIASVAALTTVFISLANVWEHARLVLSSLAVIFSAVVVVISAPDGLFDYKKLWYLYTDKWIQMQVLRSELQHGKASGDITQDEVNDLYQRYVAIKIDLNKEWKAMKGIK